MPVLAYLTMTPEGETLLAANEPLRGWWDRMTQRASVAETAPKFD